MEQINIKERNILKGIFQFIFPFSLKTGEEQNLSPYLEKHQFKAFQLNQLEKEDAFYGVYHVSHRDMEEFFLPFTNKILFPKAEDKKGFQRYSKSLNVKGTLATNNSQIPFNLHSTDITICPYELGFLTIRIEITAMSLSKAVDFASSFRVLDGNGSKIDHEGKIYPNGGSFIFESLFPGLLDFLNKDHLNGATFQAFPYIENGRMYVQSLLSLQEDEKIDFVDVYRSGSLNGLSLDGKPYVNANNLQYIEETVKQNGYDRWAPNTFYFLEENHFTCISNVNKDTLSQLASQFYGENYYSLLINLFHKLVLINIGNEYAKMNIKEDTTRMGELIYTINSFTSNYFFLVYPTQSHGRELFNLQRKCFNIDLLYNNTKETLFSLFKYEENTVAKRDSLLLLILTLYTVVCGIFSINLFTHDLKGKINWDRFKHYNIFEYFAVFLVFSGLIVVAILGIQSLYKWIIDRNNRKKWVKKTVLSTKKTQKY